MEAQRKLLEELMGTSSTDITDFRDDRVCKFYLLGLCPNTLFHNTKYDLGTCARIHDDGLKRSYEEEISKNPQRTFGYERDLEHALENHVRKNDAEIARGKQRVSEDNYAAGGTALNIGRVMSGQTSLVPPTILPPTPATTTTAATATATTTTATASVVAPVPVPQIDEAELAIMSKRIDDLLTQAEEAGESGEVAKSMSLTEEAEALKEKKAALQIQMEQQIVVAKAAAAAAAATALSASASGVGSSSGSGSSIVGSGGSSSNSLVVGDGTTVRVLNAKNFQKHHPCESCGSFLSALDSDERLSDHFGGKLHCGWVAIRTKLKELREARMKRAGTSSGGDGRGGGSGGGGGGGGSYHGGGNRGGGGRYNDYRDNRDYRRDSRGGSSRGGGGGSNRWEHDRYDDRDRHRDRDRDNYRGGGSSAGGGGSGRDRDRDYHRDGRSRDRDNYRRSRSRSNHGRSRDRDREDKGRSRSRSRDRGGQSRQYYDE